MTQNKPKRLAVLAIWAGGLAMGYAFISLNSPLKALQGDAPYLFFADQNCPYSKQGVQHIEAFAPEIATIPTRYTDDTWAKERCAEALGRLDGVAGLLWDTLAPRSVACRRLISEAREWHSVHSEDGGLPVWSQGDQMVAVGVRPESLARVGLPSIDLSAE